MRLKFLTSFLLNFILFIFSAGAVFATETVAENPQGYASIKELETVFGNFVSFVAVIGGFFSFTMVLVGGFKYITAQGDPKSLASARGTIGWAILGLAFLIFAWFILLFIEKFTGLNVTKFCLGVDCPIN